jgi:hypothetical protein
MYLQCWCSNSNSNGQLQSARGPASSRASAALWIEDPYMHLQPPSERTQQPLWSQPSKPYPGHRQEKGSPAAAQQVRTVKLINGWYAPGCCPRLPTVLCLRDPPTFSHRCSLSRESLVTSSHQSLQSPHPAPMYQPTKPYHLPR